jgi:pyruvate dehydrogenase E1 component
MPSGVEAGILKGLYKFNKGREGKHRAHIFGSGPILNLALQAQEMLADRYEVSADVWSATSYKLLRSDAIRAHRWNMLHPEAKPQKSYLETLLEMEEGAFIAVSDNVRAVPDQIAPWVPGGLMTLGTDGFGRSETRENLRSFFEIDPPMIAVATLYQLAKQGKVEAQLVSRAIQELGIDPEKVHPDFV